MLERGHAESNKAQDRANRGIWESGTPVWEMGDVVLSRGGRINKSLGAGTLGGTEAKGGLSGGADQSKPSRARPT